ncbi:MAG: flagellar protein [Planctomycetia bacterium 21-64-5]|nr:MAG: flagellar protein [Planctomycetia bacterium 21-64-5]HQU43714.1 flagellar FlbD family protein [Pirellulales bacterium]
MIKLTQLGGDEFVLNAELIKYVERRPDTIVSLTNGERLLVRETMDEVLRRAIDYQRSKQLFPKAEERQPWTSRPSAASAAASR